MVAILKLHTSDQGPIELHLISQDINALEEHILKSTEVTHARLIDRRHLNP